MSQCQKNDIDALSGKTDTVPDATRVIENLIALGALRGSMLSAVSGRDHYVLYTEGGPRDIRLSDLTKETNP